VNTLTQLRQVLHDEFGLTLTHMPGTVYLHWPAGPALDVVHRALLVAGFGCDRAEMTVYVNADEQLYSVHRTMPRHLAALTMLRLPEDHTAGARDLADADVTSMDTATDSEQIAVTLICDDVAPGQENYCAPWEYDTAIKGRGGRKALMDLADTLIRTGR
jgi:hypothetical protein